MWSGSGVVSATNKAWFPCLWLWDNAHLRFHKDKMNSVEVGGGFCLGGLLSLYIQERLSGDSALSGRAPVALSTLGEAKEVI